MKRTSDIPNVLSLIPLDLYEAYLYSETFFYTESIGLVQNFLIKKNTTLTVAERTVFIGCVKHICLNYRDSIKGIPLLIENNEQAEDKLIHLKLFHKKLIVRLKDFCETIIESIKSHLNNSLVIQSLETFLLEDKQTYLACFYKQLADFYRYICEYELNTTDREGYVSKCCEYYALCFENTQSLNAASEARLGLIMNYSVFLYEIVRAPKKALEICYLGCKEASEALQFLRDDTERNVCVQLYDQIQKNYELWKQTIIN